MTGFITNGMSMVHAPDVLIMISILNYNFYAEMVPKLSSIHTPTMSAMRGGNWTRSTIHMVFFLCYFREISFLF